MDVHKYYKMNEMLLTCIGQWPFQPRRSSRTIVAFAFFFLVAFFVPIVMAIVKFGNENEDVVESVQMTILILVCFVKCTTCAMNSKKITKLIISIGEDWKIWGADEEVTVLHAYADIGRKLTMTYSVLLQTVLSIGVFEVTLPKIVDSLFFNGTMPGEFLYPAYYFGLDKQKYFFFCAGHMAISFEVLLLIAAAFDTLFFVNVQHACGIFTAIGHKLRRLGENEVSMDEADMDFGALATCIARHNRGIEFAELIESTYSINFCVITALNMISLSLTGVQILMTQNNLRNIIKYTLYFNVQLMHLFMECYISQTLIDHSTSLRDYIHDGKWYNISAKSQKLLNLMIMRCNKPCKVTIGKVFNLSLETFVSICRKSGSYFMVLRSFQS